MRDIKYYFDFVLIFSDLSHKKAETMEFKSTVTPGSGETVISFTVSAPASLELGEVRAALAVLRGAGIRQIQDTWQPPVKKRLSEGSTISAGYHQCCAEHCQHLDCNLCTMSGGSSGYLGGSSSAITSSSSDTQTKARSR